MARICIYGVGAIGGLVAARLALAGEQVTGIARGAQLDAIRKNGLTLVAGGERSTARFSCFESPAEAGIQDFVLLTLKSHALPGIVRSIGPLLGPGTTVVTACNGLPWWYFYGASTDGRDETLESVDPGGHLWRTIGPERALGCVVYPAARVVEPGIVEHVFGDRFSLGEPIGDPIGDPSDDPSGAAGVGPVRESGVNADPRIIELAKILAGAGFDAPLAEDIRAEIWIKLVANAAYNPVSILTGGVLAQMLDDPEVSGLLQAMMNESVAVAAALGVTLPLTPAQLLDATRPFGAHRTSMLQDLDAGRSVELDPIVFAVTELARRYGLETPLLDTIAALAAQRARLIGCY